MNEVLIPTSQSWGMHARRNLLSAGSCFSQAHFLVQVEIWYDDKDQNEDDSAKKQNKKK